MLSLLSTLPAPFSFICRTSFFSTFITVYLCNIVHRVCGLQFWPESGRSMEKKLRSLDPNAPCKPWPPEPKDSRAEHSRIFAWNLTDTNRLHDWLIRTSWVFIGLGTPLGTEHFPRTPRNRYTNLTIQAHLQFVLLDPKCYLIANFFPVPQAMHCELHGIQVWEPMF